MLNGIHTVFETIKLHSNSLLNVYIFSAVVQNLSLRGGPTNMLCDITNTLEADHGPIFSIHNLEAFVRSSTVTTEASCFEQLNSISNACISVNSGILMMEQASRPFERFYHKT